MKVYDNTTSTCVTVTKSFTASGSLTLELKVYPTATTGYLEIFLQSGSTIGPRFYLRNTGQMAYYVGTTWYDVGAYNSSQWNTIKLVVNCGSDTFDIYLDGSLKKTGQPSIRH